MFEKILSYQQAMGWNDPITIQVLCDFIETLLPEDDAEQRSAKLEQYLKRRAAEEASWCNGKGEEDEWYD